MAPKPLMARCRSCDTAVELAHLAATGDGRCPGCGEQFSGAGREVRTAARHLDGAVIDLADGTGDTAAIRRRLREAADSL